MTKELLKLISYTGNEYLFITINETDVINISVICPFDIDITNILRRTMTDLEFETLGKNIITWKHEYYVLGNPSLADESYDYQEYLYCQEAQKRGILKNDLGEVDEDGKFHVFVGHKE